MQFLLDRKDEFQQGSCACHTGCFARFAGMQNNKESPALLRRFIAPPKARAACEITGIC